MAAEKQCQCVHFRASHPDDGPCERTLAAVDWPEEDWHLPEWRCPCPGYRPTDRFGMPPSVARS